VLLFDPDDRILLFLTRDRLGRWPPFWLTPGGGLDEGESFEAAARRELLEETGISECDLWPCVWERDCVSWYSGNPVHVVEQYFVGRTTTTTVDTRGQLAYELTALSESRWWSLPGILSSKDEFQPGEFAPLLAGLVSEGPPPVPRALRL
jgi:8-oxo-dGTP pyrophosphatase MutT (NUDIX family)